MVYFIFEDYTIKIKKITYLDGSVMYAPYVYLHFRMFFCGIRLFRITRKMVTYTIKMHQTGKDTKYYLKNEEYNYVEKFQVYQLAYTTAFYSAEAWHEQYKTQKIVTIDEV